MGLCVKLTVWMWRDKHRIWRGSASQQADDLDIIGPRPNPSASLSRAWHDLVSRRSDMSPYPLTSFLNYPSLPHIHVTPRVSLSPFACTPFHTFIAIFACF